MEVLACDLERRWCGRRLMRSQDSSPANKPMHLPSAFALKGAIDLWAVASRCTFGR